MSTSKFTSVGVPDGVATFAFPCSYSQRRLWFINQLNQGSALYNVPFELRMKGPLDVEALKKALREIVKRHEVLRTVFVEDANGEPEQRVGPIPEFPITLIDLSELDFESRQRKAASYIEEESSLGFDLAQGPLIRVKLLRLTSDDHVLLLNMHHIVSDGWSLGVLGKELTALYDAFVRGRLSPLPELPIQYCDYAVWLRDWVQSGALQPQLDYWTMQLKGIEPLELPKTYSRHASSSHRGATLSFRLSAELTEQLTYLGRRENATIFMTLLTGFQILLARYSGQKDFIVGTPVAGRGSTELEGLIGCFVNTLVMRARLNNTLTVRQLLAEVRQTALGAYSHQDIPFEMLVEKLQPHRGENTSPLIQVMFAVQNVPVGKMHLTDLATTVKAAPTATAKFDLALAFYQEHGQLEGTLEYSTDIFNRERMLHLQTHLERVLEACCVNPEQNIWELDFLTAYERDSLVLRWNQTEMLLPDETVLSLFEKQAECRPEADAIVDGGITLAFKDLNRRANQLAHYLTSVGIGPETRVALCLERSVESIIAMLAVMKAGGAYVPLDPAYPVERLRLAIEDSQAKVLLTNNRAWRFLEIQEQVLNLDEIREQISTLSDQNLIVTPQPDNLAYVIYTSGSTGKAKGVAISHRGLLNLVQWHRQTYQLTVSDRMIQFASLAFDASVWEIWPALSAGASLVLVNEIVRLNPTALPEWLAQSAATVAFLPTPVAEVALKVDWPQESRMRFLLTGGDQLHRKFAGSANCKVVNHYGPTEITVVATAYPISGDTDCPDLPPIGRPIANTRVYVLDEEMGLVPVGVAGELYIGGAGLARGYLNRPELTAERFVPSPYAAGEAGGERLYRTGDRAKWQGEGELEFLGRLDHQVKVRGYRIELGEIEATLNEHRYVEQAVAVVQEDEGREKRLVAYVVKKAGVAQGLTEELRGYLRERLPEQMVPAVVMELEQMPLTPNGKIDRKRLPRPETAGNEEKYVRPRNEVEEIVCGIWAQVLGLERVGVEDNFFDLGGHSLLATQVVAQLRSALEVELPLQMVFNRPTVQRMAEAVEQIRRSEQKRVPERMERRSGEEPALLSFAQQRLWFLNQLEPGSSAYNIPMGLRLKGELDGAALAWSLGEIVRRHEVLRTRFVMQGGQPVQVVEKWMGVELEEEDLTELTGQEQDDRVRTIGQQEARQSFDLSQGQVLRVKLLRLGEREHVLLVTMHHIVGDGWSMGVWVKELSRLYEAHARGTQLKLPELALQYSDYAMWQRKWLQGEVLAEQVEHWRKQLSALEMLELPLDHRREAEVGKRARKQRFVVGKELTKKLQELSRSEGVTLFMTMLAGLQILLARYSGQEDIAVGVPIAGRNRSEIQELIGFFVNTLVMRTEVSGGANVKEILRRVRKATLEAYDHQDVPFEKLVEELQPQRDLSRSPFFQVMLVMQNLPQAELKMGGLEVEGFDSQEGGEAKFDLSWSVVEKGGRLEGEVDYAEELFKEATIHRMVVHLERVLESMAASREQQIRSIGLLTESEERQVVQEWNRTEKEYGPEKTIVELFEEQVVRRPNAVALEYERQELCYAELNRRANQLGHYLRKHGVAPEVPVGICMERSLEMVVGLLGILKAGGAYLPLDPTYPHDRMAYVLENSHVPVLLLQEQFRSQFLNFNGHTIAVDKNWDEIAGESEVNLLKVSGMENLVYVIYTSGSTGQPKGVMNVHGGLRNRLLWMQQEYRLDRTDRVLQKTPYTFDVSVWEFFWPLITGARLVMARPGGHHDPQYLSATIQSAQITTLHFVPAMLGAWLDSETAGHCPTLKRVICSGEALSLEAQRKFTNKVTAELHNLYGPTEASIDVTYWRCREEGSRDFVPIGKPIANTQVYVLDETMRPLPVGVSGELFLGGKGLARGYLRRPDLTAERFIPNPFSDKAGQRLYRTGDRVRWQADGSLEFLGRIDFQVKVRGYRIELGEIEAVLGSHPGVRETVVAVKGEGADKSLVGYWVENRESAVGLEELKNYLREKLPVYMVPAILVKLEKLPLSGNGKVDRKALPDPRMLRRTGDAPCVLPRNEMEKAIAAIWQQVLRRDKIGIHDNFFECGGHSLSLTQIHGPLQQLSKRELLLTDLFKYPTIASLAEYMIQTNHAEPKQTKRKENRLGKLKQRRAIFEKRLTTKVTVQ